MMSFCPEPLVSYSQGMAINDFGEIVWSQANETTGGYTQIFSDRRGQITNEPTDHYYPALNNLGDVVWMQPTQIPQSPWAVYGLIDGTIVHVAGEHGRWVQFPAINRNNFV